MLVIVLVRLTAAIFIFRFPLFGGLLAVVLDYFDYSFLTVFEPDKLTHYQQLDKILDLFYLSLEAYVALTFRNKVVRFTALGLFFFRFVGEVLFYITKQEVFLVVFPNLFEWFYLSYLLQLKFLKKDYLANKRSILLLLLIILLPKLVHEYFLHVNRTQPWTQNIYVKRFFGF